MTTYICNYDDLTWSASYELIESSDKYSILLIQSKYKDLKIFLWHNNNQFWLADPYSALSCTLSHPSDEFWNYESLNHCTEDEIISKTIARAISIYYKER